MDEKNNNLTTKNSSTLEKPRRSSIDFDGNNKRERPTGKTSFVQKE